MEVAGVASGEKKWVECVKRTQNVLLWGWVSNEKILHTRRQNSLWSRKLKNKLFNIYWSWSFFFCLFVVHLFISHSNRSQEFLSHYKSINFYFCIKMFSCVPRCVVNFHFLTQFKFSVEEMIYFHAGNVFSKKKKLIIVLWVFFFFGRKLHF